jgi:hypothetical protein
MMQTAAKDLPAAGAKDSRRARRFRSKIAVLMEFQGRTIPGRLFDLSETGLSISLDQAFFGQPGSQIIVRCQEIGLISGVVRWVKERKVGVMFSQSSASVAQVKAYFRFFHKIG